MVSEFFAAGGGDVAISLIPGEAGVLTVEIDGEMVFDKKTEGGHPNLDRIKEIKADIAQRVRSLG